MSELKEKTEETKKSPPDLLNMLTSTAGTILDAAISTTKGMVPPPAMSLLSGGNVNSTSSTPSPVLSVGSAKQPQGLTGAGSSKDSMTRKLKHHWKSASDLTPEGILTEDESSDDDEETSSTNTGAAKSPAMNAILAKSPILASAAGLFKKRAQAELQPVSLDQASGEESKQEEQKEGDQADNDGQEKSNEESPTDMNSPPQSTFPNGQKRDLVLDILEELGTSPAPAAHTLDPNPPPPLLMKRSTSVQASQPSRTRPSRTKIICAIGPQCQSQKMLGELLDAGMNVARLNFSHGDHEYHATSVRNLRAAIAERRAKGMNCRCAILLDTKGPEIRTGKLEGGNSLHLVEGQLVEFTGMEYDLPGNDRLIKCSYENLAEDLQPGNRILIADGELCLEVLICKPERKSVICRVQNNFILGERKNVSLPGIAVRLPGITERDRHDITNFALVHNVDIISGSFTRTAANVRALRECLNGAKIRVHAKIESVEALAHLDEIIAEADGVHVSRGDLGMELPLSKLPLVQKAIIHAANVAGKPVVTSTQLLQSMVENPRPTNAECTDVANAVLDGSDCVMLSAETANGKYPIKAVQTMARILIQAERLVNWENTYADTREETLQQKGFVPLMEAICSTAVETAIELRSKLIIVASDSGRMGLLVAKYRPRARIVVITESELVANQMSGVSRGVEAFVIPSIRNLDIVWDAVCAEVLTKERYRLPENHPVVLVDSPPAAYDTRYELSQKSNEGMARWNMIRVMRVPLMEQ
jgi:pyruvate kinase